MDIFKGRDYLLLFDTETTGLPTDKAISHPSQPTILQIHAELVDRNWDTKFCLSTLLKDTRNVADDNGYACKNVHKITKARADRDGLDPIDTLTDFIKLAGYTEDVTTYAYNAPFDTKMVRCTLQEEVLPEFINTHCAMKMYMRYIKATRYRKLVDAYRQLTGKHPDESKTHDASYDVMMMKEVLKKLDRPVRSPIVKLYQELDKKYNE